MKLISWNVNGLRACIQKGFLDFFQLTDADFFCLQETKLSEGQLALSLPGYYQYWCYAAKKGYSGTAIFTKHKPLSVSYGIGEPELDNEGRVITLEYPEFYLVNCYTPNAQRGLARLDHRMKWDEAYREYISSLDAKKPTILCGDLNVAHQEIDLKNPKTNRGNAGFSDEERDSFSKTLSLGFTDSFRYLHPNTTGAYTWWSYLYHAREHNAGWRIDYFLTSDRIRERIYNTPIYSDVFGSDHCPVGLELDISCNGSVWVESESGTPVEVLPEKKSAKKVSKRLLAVLAVIVIAGLGGYTVKFSLPSGQDYVRFHAYDRNLKFEQDIYSGIHIIKGSLFDGENRWNLYSLESGNIPPQPSDNWNFFLRLDIEENRLTEYNGQWQLTVLSTPLQAIYIHESDNTPLYPTSDNVYHLSLHRYYEGEDPADVRGWFLFGRIPADTTFYFTLSTGEKDIKFTYRAKPSISIPSVAEIRAMPTKQLVESITTDSNIQNLPEDSNIVSWYDAAYQSIKESNPFLVELELREDAIPYLIASLKEGTDSQFQIAKFLLSSKTFQNMLTDEQEYEFNVFLDEKYALTPQQLSILSTNNLANYVLAQEAIVRALSEGYLTTQSHWGYEDLVHAYPALQELQKRTDLIDQLMRIGNMGEAKNTAVKLLLYYNREMMTPYQEIRYILYCSNANSLTDVIHFPDELQNESKTTIELAKMLVLDSQLGYFLSRTSKQETRDEIYRASSATPAKFQSIINREDFIDALFQIFDDASFPDQLYIQAFLSLSDVQQQMTQEQKIRYEEDYSQHTYTEYPVISPETSIPADRPGQ